MKILMLSIALTCFSLLCFGQRNLISYDDIKYLLHNNLNEADTFLAAKGYLTIKKDVKNKNRKYNLSIAGGTFCNVNLRSDGKRIFMDIETNEIDQYNLIKESIAQFLIKDANAPPGIESYSVKDLGSIYITINDTVPYNPIKKDYDIQIVSDKHVTAYN
jgi:hypothetical protein